MVKIVILVIFKVWRISGIHVPKFYGPAQQIQNLRKYFFMSLAKCKRKITPLIVTFSQFLI